MSVHNWLKSRHFSTTAVEYIYKPNEVKKRIALKSIFENFDADGNGSLEIEEFLDMFIKIYITENYKNNFS